MKLLLLAGTGEARELARALDRAGVPAVASLAGATRHPKPLAIPTRVGGFGDAQGFFDYLRAEKISHVLDATHPFASRMSLRSAEVCAGMSVDYAQVLRPAWEPEAGDRWEMIAREEDAAEYIAEDATVFLATGRQTLEGFRNLEGRRLILRQIDPPTAPFPWEGGEFLIGRPPFSVEDEVSVFTRLGVDWLIVKNAGGVASRSKLDAARQLGLSVAMIARPAQPDARKFETAEAAMDWVRRHG
ncbi:MAG: cobalt-precorrin-6A reductase [Paracoccaceae bacterium]|nr:cobalt-precorrin-6A reductase [Paracoccaceae bacterium]